MMATAMPVSPLTNTVERLYALIMSSIAITLNGEPRRIGAGLSVAGLVESIGLPITKVAVERNRMIVPRSTLVDVMLTDGDELEIVHFVGGG
jgi:thiamine biosynthesis protein ThiS